MKIFNELELKLEDKFKSLNEKKRSHNNLINSILESNDEYINAVNELGKLKFNLAKAEYSKNPLCEKLKKEVANKNVKISKIVDDIRKYYNFSTYKYACDFCEDKGYINGKPCKCRNKYLSEIILGEAGIQRKDLSSFEFNSPENLTPVYEILHIYASKLPATNKIANWVFSGAPGTGKTYLSKAVANLAEKNGNVVIYLTANELNGIFLKMHLGSLDKTFTFDCFTNCDLLVIDDLGTEPIYNNVTVEYIVSLISSRIDLKKPFILTTNLDLSELKSRYNDRLSSRLSDKSTTRFLTFGGVDLRTAPPKNIN